MSIDANPSIKEIATTFGDTPPYSMSELYGLNFSSGNAVTSGTISLSGFRNKTVESILDETKVWSSDGAAGDYFGISVSISDDGSTVVVATDRHEDNRGAAYIFEKVNGVWTQMAKLTASDRASFDKFGRSLTISGDGSTVVVSARQVDNFNGAVYIFNKGGSGWSSMTETVKLTTSDVEYLDEVGSSLSISGDGSTFVVGVHADDNRKGSAYIFDEEGGVWTETVKLTSSDGVEDDVFGWYVAISDDGSTVVVGAYDDGNGLGGAYIFEKVNGVWTEMAKLTSTDNVGPNNFGSSVSISGDGSTVVVGASRDDTYTGATYIFEKGVSGWSSMTETAELTTSDVLGTYSRFGESVSISNDGSKAFVGAEGVDAVYIFEKGGSGWSSMTETTKLTASDAGDDSFGGRVSISGDGSVFVVGAYLDHITTNGVQKDYQGSAYIYETRYFVN